MSEPHMTPAQAHGYLVAMEEQQVSAPAPWVVLNALNTIADMQTEVDRHIIPHEQVDGHHKIQRYERHVTEWRPVE